MNADARPQAVVLIISTDAVGAALLGALLETLGYVVCFAARGESADDAMRRTRPTITMLDAADADSLRTDVIGRAQMRGIALVLFGTADALRGADAIAGAHALDRVTLPASSAALRAALAHSLHPTV